MKELLKKCTLCPRECKTDRTAGAYGFCKSDDRIKIARCALHFWEEPSISGTRGSGAVFFSNCTMKCVFCQNHQISAQSKGYFITENELCDIFLNLQNQGAHNINLVTPTHYIAGIIPALKSAKKNGLKIPVIYNSGGYEKAETIRLLNGLIDVYLPDLKYFDDKYSLKYSSAPHYFKRATEAISEMFSQVGECRFNEDGIIQRGVIVRHLMLPGLMFDTKKILDYLHKEYKSDIFISIMSQYTPLCSIAKTFPELNRKISKEYYNTIIDYAIKIGIENAYIQDSDSANECYIPEFFGD